MCAVTIRQQPAQGALARDTPATACVSLRRGQRSRCSRGYSPLALPRCQPQGRPVGRGGRGTLSLGPAMPSASHHESSALEGCGRSVSVCVCVCVCVCVSERETPWGILRCSRDFTPGSTSGAPKCPQVSVYPSPRACAWSCVPAPLLLPGGLCLQMRQTAGTLLVILSHKRWLLWMVFP